MLWTEEMILRNREALEVPFEPCFVDGDYKPANVVVECVDGVWRVSGVFDYVVHADFGEHNVVLECTEDGWRVSGVFDWMTAHVGDGAADLSLPVTMYLNRDVAQADGFVQTYLEHRPVPPGFVELQKLYMLSLKLSFWEYWQREKGRLPEDETGVMSFEQCAGPSVAYWEKYR